MLCKNVIIEYRCWWTILPMCRSRTESKIHRAGSIWEHVPTVTKTTDCRLLSSIIHSVVLTLHLIWFGWRYRHSWVHMVISDGLLHIWPQDKTVIMTILAGRYTYIECANVKFRKWKYRIIMHNDTTHRVFAIQILKPKQNNKHLADGIIALKSQYGGRPWGTICLAAVGFDWPVLWANLCLPWV